LSVGWAYVFRHTTLGYLGRIVLQGRPDGQTHVVSEVAGDPDDPMTPQRAAIFTPLSTVLTRQLDIATGGRGDGRQDAPPARLPEPQQVVESKHIQCEQCHAVVALLIFADQATDQGGLEDYARLMHAHVKAFNVPTWVIGPPSGNEPLPERPADIVKIWPQREPLQRLRPAEFNPLLDPLIQGHCGSRRGVQRDERAVHDEEEP
jgi:hypothetical protein